MAKKKIKTPTYGTSTNYGDPTAQFQKLQAESNALLLKQEEQAAIQREGLPNLTPTEDPYKIKVSKSGGGPSAPPKAQLTTPEVFTSSDTGRASGITLPNGQTYLGLSPSDVQKIANQEAERTAIPEGTSLVGTAQEQVNQAFQAQQLAGQVGQFDQLGVSPTGLDINQAATQGLVQGIPRALTIVGGAVAAGAALGTVAAPGIGTIIGGAVGLIGGISSSMISNLKSQRTDTTNAQKRVLDEGKQNLNDWATLAAADPANRAQYIANFNQQLALIDQAYRQMKLDTSRDVAKFETALPDLAEFETFYSTQGERDFIVSKMYQALGAVQDPEYIYQLAELNQRRVK